jgi:hypothetical protein
MITAGKGTHSINAMECWRTNKSIVVFNHSDRQAVLADAYEALQDLSDAADEAQSYAADEIEDDDEGDQEGSDTPATHESKTIVVALSALPTSAGSPTFCESLGRAFCSAKLEWTIAVFMFLLGVASLGILIAIAVSDDCGCNSCSAT